MTRKEKINILHDCWRISGEQLRLHAWMIKLKYLRTLKEDNNKLIQRWEMYNVDESTDKDGECVCGRTGLRWLFFMKMKGFESWPFHTRIVGSECIRWFCRGNPRSAMVAFARFLK